jgi:tetratricopeptide (TPR) repeat protein
MMLRNLMIIAALGLLVGVGGALVWKKTARQPGVPEALSEAATSTAATPSLEAVARCDALASHPDDPERLVEAGVDDEQLDADAVVEACSKALQADPDDARLHYQLARGLLAQGDANAAMEHLTTAAEAEHGAALAALGSIFLDGLDDIEPDLETGMKLLEQAVAAGFEPAREMLALAQTPQEEEVQVATPAAPTATAAPAAAPRPLAAVAKPVNFAAYELPRFMDAIYQGQYGDTGLNDLGKAGYVINMATAFRQTCRGPFTTSEIEGWKSHFLGQAMRPEVAGKALTDGLTMMMEMMQNPQAAVQKYSGSVSMDQVPMMAQQDAMGFIGEHGCDGPVFERFTANLRSSLR